jgi:hypothetical protein
MHQKKQDYLSNSAESQAESERVTFYLTHCVFDEAGVLIFKDKEDLERQEEDDAEFVGTITYHFLLFMNDLDENELNTIPGYDTTEEEEEDDEILVAADDDEPETTIVEELAAKVPEEPIPADSVVKDAAKEIGIPTAESTPGPAPTVTTG